MTSELQRMKKCIEIVSCNPLKEVNIVDKNSSNFAKKRSDICPLCTTSILDSLKTKGGVEMKGYQSRRTNTSRYVAKNPSSSMDWDTHSIIGIWINAKTKNENGPVFVWSISAAYFPVNNYMYQSVRNINAKEYTRYLSREGIATCLTKSLNTTIKFANRIWRSELYASQQQQKEPSAAACITGRTWAFFCKWSIMPVGLSRTSSCSAFS